MGAELAGCRAVPVPVNDEYKLDLSKVDQEDVKRALLLWINSPCNPTGVLEDIQSLVEWGRNNDVPIFSDECYVEFIWGQKPSTILHHGNEGVVAVHFYQNVQTWQVFERGSTPETQISSIGLVRSENIVGR